MYADRPQYKTISSKLSRCSYHSPQIYNNNFSSAISFDYICAAINQRSGCLSTQNHYHTGIAATHAFGSNKAICLIGSNYASNGELMILSTISGHKDVVSCTSWIAPFNGPTAYTFDSLLLSGSADGVVKIWKVESNMSSEFGSFEIPSSISINALYGCYLDENQTSILVGVASESDITGWLFNFSSSTSCDNEKCPIPQLVFTLNRASDFCLALRIVCVDSRNGPPICLIFAGMSNGVLEIWSSVVSKDSLSEPILSGSLKGHTDWLRCLDTIKNYKFAPENETTLDPLPREQILVATGSQDNHIRIWHLQFCDSKKVLRTPKGFQLTLPNLNNTNDGTGSTIDWTLYCKLESVLAGHDNWVTGLAWSPKTWKLNSCPQLLSASMDKSLIIWSSTSPPMVTDNTSCDDVGAPDVWKETQRFGTVGGNQLGFLDCAWENSGAVAFGHGFQGNLSCWSVSSDNGGQVKPNSSLTGHLGPITDLAWAPDKFSNLNVNQEEENSDIPLYLLSASQDQTVRLHGPVEISGTGCSPPVCVWKELARTQVHGYDMNAVACIDMTQYVSAGDEKVIRVMSATKKFVHRILPDHVINKYRTSIESLPLDSVQPALGLSNQAATSDEPESVNLTDRTYSEDIPCPPTEEFLAQSTLWVETKKLYGHSYEVFCLAVHPLGTLVASACKASKPEFADIFLWCTKSWSIHQKLNFHQLTVTQLLFDSTGDRLLSVSRDRTWGLWKLDTSSVDSERQIRTYNLHKKSPSKGGHSRIIWTAAWTPDDEYFLTGSRDKRIMIWSAESGNQLGQPVTMPEAVTALDVSSALLGDYLQIGSSIVAAGLESGEIHIHGFKTNANQQIPPSLNLLLVLPNDTGSAVKRIVFYHPKSDDIYQHFFASAGEDGIVRVSCFFPNLFCEQLQLTN